MSLTLQQRKTLKKESFTVDVSKDISLDGTLNLHIDNPSGSDRELYFVSIRIYHEEQIDTVFHSDVSSVSGGIASSIDNNYLGGQGSVATATQDVTFTSDKVHTAFGLVGAQSSGVNILAKSDIVIPEGHDVVVECTDVGGSGSNNVSIQMTFFEINT